MDDLPGCINKFTLNMLSNDSRSSEITAAAERMPDAPSLQLYSASLFLYPQTDAATAKAKEYIKQAESLKKHFTEYEHLLFNAVKAWSKLDYYQAIKIFKQALEHNPRDLLSLKYAEWLYYVIGQKYYANDFYNLCESINSHNQSNPYFLSIYAFAAELNGMREQSLNAAQSSLEVMPDLVWSQHAVAHVYLMQGRVDDCIHILEQSVSSWNNIVPTLQSHMYWHLSLAYIANKEDDKAIDLFDKYIWNSDNQEVVLVHQDSISFLCRMSMLGNEYSHYWPDIIDKIKEVCSSQYMPFNTIHYLFASAKTNNIELTDEILKSAIKYANLQTFEAKEVWKTIGTHAFQGVIAFAVQDYMQAADALGKCIVKIGCMGGSDAEIELFHMIYCYCLSKSNQKAKAVSHFEAYLKHYAKTRINAILL